MSATETLRPEVSYFNDKSAAYRAEYDRETPEGYSFRMRREKVLALTPDKATVLDIASGPGVMIAGLRKKGCTPVCVDAAPEMIARAKEEFPDAESVVGDAYGLPFDASRFDTALAMGLIEYLEDEKKFLGEAKRVLKPGGALIVTFPNYLSPWRAFNRAVLLVLRAVRKLLGKEKFGPVTHREYTLMRAKWLLSTNGFEPKRVRYYNFKLVPHPLDVRFPRFTVALSKVFETLDRTPLRFIGTGFIVEAVKKA